MDDLGLTNLQLMVRLEFLRTGSYGYEGNSTFPKAPEIRPHYQKQYTVISRNLEEDFFIDITPRKSLIECDGTC